MCQVCGKAMVNEIYSFSPQRDCNLCKIQRSKTLSQWTRVRDLVFFHVNPYMGLGPEWEGPVMSNNLQQPYSG